MTKVNTTTKAVPFLRWAGGKSWLLKKIDRFLPSNGFNDYHEPFLGGGAIFFCLAPSKKSFLNDINKELIQTYKYVQTDVEDVIDELKQFVNEEEFYYEIRARRFESGVKEAAKFIYLNQTSFNGIYRVNRNGEYNVPFGYRKKNFFQPDVLRMASEQLKQVTLESNDFFDQAERVKKKDLVFLDPPYTITHNNNGFLKYNKKLFSEEDQLRLSRMIDKIKSKGAYYILTNAAHERVSEIFEKGDKRVELERASLVGGKQAERDRFSESVFTNI